MRLRQASVRLASDYPLAVSLLIVVLVMMHFFLAQKVVWLDVPSALASTRTSDPVAVISSVAPGAASVSALVGGFAGVIVIFGLETDNEHFRKLRLKGRGRLRANWVSTVLTSFAGAFGSVLASIIVVGYDVKAGVWVLELFLLFAAHGALRLTALLIGLANVVDANDQTVDRATRVAKTKDVL